MKKEYLTVSTALAKLQKYCAYQDRCHQEVRYKLLKLGVRGLDVEVIMAELIKENFLNEERFAKSYCRGKFYMKGWGKVKIANELRKRNISAYCMKKGMEEIGLQDYRKRLKITLAKKIKSTVERDPYKLKQKLVAHALQKGYESELIYHILEELK